MTIPWHEFGEIVAAHQRFVISSHVRPDADALGSELAMAALLTERGKSVRIINPSAAPSSLEFLDPDGLAEKFGNGVRASDVCETDVHLIVDTSSWVQLAEVGKAMQRSHALRVIIDHHVSSDNLGATEFRDMQAEATGAMIFRMTEALDWHVSHDVAQYLFCAIVTDTGWFRFPSTTADTMRIAGRLIDAGVQPHLVYQQLYEQYPLARLKLAGRVLSRIVLECDGRLAYTTVPWNDFEETGARPVDTEDLVNECLTLKGTECAFIAVEQQNRRVKFSLRSRTGLDVAAVAAQFGGGGHKQAAGTVLDGPLDAAVEKVVTTMRSAVQATQPPSANSTGS